MRERSAKVIEAYITIMVHKPSGVWKKHWFSVTAAIPADAWAWSAPFGKAKDIPKYVDEAKRLINKGRVTPLPITIYRVKEDPSLPFHDEEEGTVDWKELFRGRVAIR